MSTPISIEDFDGRDTISVQELAALRAAGKAHLVLDVREHEELEICRLDGALHIPMASVPARVSELPVQGPLVVMCHHGGRSRMVTDYLRNAGLHNAVNLEGGIDAYARLVDDSLRLY
jgi:rhodanese-related sulfurtransferase